MMPMSFTIGPTTPMHVLIVEDDADTRDMYQELLTQSGFRVTLASNGAEALAQARTLQPDIITTDLGRDGALFDGCELAAQLKRSPETEAIPVIAVTGWAGEVDRNKALQAGYDAVLPKPCQPAELVAAICRLLQARALIAPSQVQSGSSGDPRRRPARVARRTTSPPMPPPPLRCPKCDRRLAYLESTLSGVAPAEQWDRFACRRCQIELEYRQRTRRLKVVPHH
jgi:CheY-like chemotaxis protein